MSDVPEPRPRRGRFVRLSAAALAAALLAVVVNLATSSLPSVVSHHQALTWLTVPLAVLLVAVAEWWKERGVRAETIVGPDPIVGYVDGGQFIPLRSPEVPARKAADAYTNRRFQEAFGLYVRALDRLHDFYSIDQMRIRQPSATDAWILNGLTSSLGAAGSLNPHLDVRNDHGEAEARLRDIIDVGTRAGIDMRLYRQTLAELGRYRYQPPAATG